MRSLWLFLDVFLHSGKTTRPVSRSCHMQNFTRRRKKCASKHCVAKMRRQVWTFLRIWFLIHLIRTSQINCACFILTWTRQRWCIFSNCFSISDTSCFGVSITPMCSWIWQQENFTKRVLEKYRLPGGGINVELLNADLRSKYSLDLSRGWKKWRKACVPFHHSKTKRGAYSMSNS